MSEDNRHPRALPVVEEQAPPRADQEQGLDPRPIPVLCRKLRTKMAFGSMHPGLRDWRHGDSTTAVYWCLMTMESVGPDDSFAHAHACGRGRECFVPPAGEEDIA